MAALAPLVTACGTVPNVDVLCEASEPRIVALAALEAEMTDNVALAADELITVIDAACDK